MQKAHDASKNNWWENLPSIATPIVAEELNRNETSVDTIDDRVVAFDTTKANQTDLLLAVKSISFNKNTGVFTITKFNNTSATIDTDIEKIAINFDYDDDPTSPHYQHLVITLDDGTVKYIDMSALVTQYDFSDSAQIHFTNTSGTISATIINGSITEEKLQPNFLADCRSAKAGAETAETNAKASEDEANAWANGEIDGVPVPSTHPAYHNNAKYYKDLANPTSLMALTDTDITNPASGDVLTFNGEKWENKEGINGEEKTSTDDFTTINGGLLSECKVSLIPVQNKHGYSEPWVGGSRKNKLPLVLADIKSANTSGTWTGNNYTISGVTLTVLTDSSDNVIGIKTDRTANAQIIFYLGNTPNSGDYILNGCPVGGSHVDGYSIYITGVYVYDIGSGTNVSLSGTSYSVAILIRNGTDVSNKTFYPMLRLSTETDPTFEPYENICPISGHTQVDVDVVGKNLFDETYPNISQSIQYKAINVGEGTFTLKTNAPRYDNSGCAVFLLSGNVSSGATNNDHGAYDGNPRTQTATNGYVTVAYRTISDIDPRNYDVFLYDNVTQKTYVIQLGSTYYSGTLDVVSGVFTPDMAGVDLGTLTWLYYGGDRFLAQNQMPDVKIDADYRTPRNAICSQYIWRAGDTLYSNPDAGFSYYIESGFNRLFVKDMRYSDANVFKTAMSGVQLVYELANPTPIQLTPTQVQALVGENHFSAPLDGQEIGEVKYSSIAKWNDVVQDDTTSLETTWSSDKINTDIGAVASSVTALASRVGTNETNIAGLTTRVGTLETNASKITWSNSVNALVDDTTVTISNASITTTSIIEPFYSNASGDNVVIKNQTATTGQVVLTFDALLEATSFRVRITNL